MVSCHNDRGGGYKPWEGTGKMRFLILAVLMVLLSACIAAGRNTGSLPASATIPALSPGISPGDTSTIAITTTVTSTPSLTPVPPSVILADFPLSVGATWKYSAEISYQDPIDYSKLVTWSGFITDKVVDREMTPDGKIVFTLHEDLKPTPPQDVWRQPGTYEYTIAGNGIFEDGIKIYLWPLSDHLVWKEYSDYGYDTHAKYTGIVSTPYGDLKGCYTFILQTNPDTSFDTFCPKIGFVEHSYIHHGTPQVEHFMLVSYQPGQ
jgi:hypothetical protein